VGLRERQPFGDEVDTDDALHAELKGDAAGKLPDGTEADHRQGASLGHVGVLDRLPGRGEDVREVEEALVRVLVRHLDRAEVRLGHPEVLRLAARHGPIE